MIPLAAVTVAADMSDGEIIEEKRSIATYLRITCNRCGEMLEDYAEVPAKEVREVMRKKMKAHQTDGCPAEHGGKKINGPNH